jgi:hypothetical protein
VGFRSVIAGAEFVFGTQVHGVAAGISDLLRKVLG